MENNKQTAVQWLVYEYFGGIENCTPDFQHHINKALEMEKEQIESAYKEGYDMGYDHGFHEDEPDEEGEKFYYTETFKSDGETLDRDTTV